jgi:ribosomal protein S18 acetylase RimI-like enzyme
MLWQVERSARCSLLLFHSKKSAKMESNQTRSSYAYEGFQMKRENLVSLETKQIPKTETTLLLPILSDAEEGEERIRATLLDLTCTAYASYLHGQLAGAAVVRWEEDEPNEIVYIAVAPDLRGRGYGKQIIHVLQEELHQRQGHSLLVGTANTSLENIAFYQKCGFRMFEVRRDYFAYIQPPIVEHGIVLRDMLVLRYDVG